jgi:hypothetical protein
VQSPSRAVLLVALLFIAARGPLAAASGPNLLAENVGRDLTNAREGWHTETWLVYPGTTDYHWIASHNGEPVELEIVSHHDNDARWAKTLALAGGWYYLSVEARTEKVFPFMTGANLTVLDDGIRSADIRGTRDWQRLSLYLKVPKGGTEITLALRLGGFMNLSRGAAFFRNPSIAKIPGPPSGSAYVYDLAEIRRLEPIGPIGRPWSIVAVFIALFLVALAGASLLGPHHTGDPLNTRRDSAGDSRLPSARARN